MKNYIRIKNLFRGLLITYLFTISIPIILAIVITGTAKDISISREIDTYTSALEQGMNLFEKQLKEYDELAQRYMYSYELSAVLRKQGMESDDKHIYDVVKFQEGLKVNFSDTMVRDNYALLLNNGMAFNNATMTSDLSFFYAYFRRHENLSFEAYRDKSFGSTERTLLPMQTIYVNKASYNAITYNFPLKVSGNNASNKVDACVQFLIQEDYFKSLFSSIMVDAYTSIYIIDDVSTIIANVGLHRDIPLTFNEQKGSITLEDNLMMIYVKSPVEGYTYVAVLPDEKAVSYALNLQKVLLGWVVFLGSISIGLGVFFSWKYSVPIKNLVNNIESLMAPESALDINPRSEQNEYEYLQESFQKLIRANKNNKSRSFYNYLFSGEFKQNRDVIQEGEKLGLKLGEKRYCVACVEGNNRQKDVLEFLKIVKNDSVIGYQEIGRIVAILFGYESDKDDDFIYSDVQRFCKDISKDIGSDCPTGIGLIYANEIDISFSYNQSGIALASARKSDNRDSTITKYAIFTMDGATIFYPREISEKLMNLTRQGEVGKLAKWLKVIEDENFNKRNLSFSMERLLISVIVSTMLGLMNDETHIGDRRSVEKILSYSDYHLAMNKIIEQFEVMCKQYNGIQESRKNVNQKMLHDYLEEHYMDDQLTLSVMAENLAFSEGYFSQFFKDNMGEVFSKYLEKMRIQKAKEYIRQGDETLEMISVKVGYSNSGTFRRAFKRVTGVSPSKWA